MRASSALPDFTPAASLLPAPTKAEYEVTDNIVHSGCHDRDEENLKRLLNHPDIVARASAPYVEKLRGKKFYRASEYDHALKTLPQTWYLNTKDQALKGTDNLRVRFTPYLDKYFELAVKGKAAKFNGPGGLLRHEDEIHSGFLQLDPRAFTDPVSREIVNPLVDQTIHFFHLTSVTRYLVGIEDEVNGQKGMSEIAFDIIRYQHHTDHPDEPLRTFFRLCQNEREYLNPNSDLHRPFCQEMGYEMMQPEEIERLLDQSSKIVRTAAQDLGIDMEPCPYSKGQIGFAELGRAQGRVLAAPPSLRFPVCF